MQSPGWTMQLMDALYRRTRYNARGGWCGNGRKGWGTDRAEELMCGANSARRLRRITGSAPRLWTGVGVFDDAAEHIEPV